MALLIQPTCEVIACDDINRAIFDLIVHQDARIGYQWIKKLLVVERDHYTRIHMYGVHTEGARAVGDANWSG
jgi:hypothetical protein